jgi:hypothetical protein
LNPICPNAATAKVAGVPPEQAGRVHPGYPYWQAHRTRRGSAGSRGRRKALGNTASPCAPPTTPELPKLRIRLVPSPTAPPAGTRRTSPWRRHEALFRREFPPTEYRNHDADQHRDRTSDGPGGGVAHRATTKHSESLERPDQTEHCDDQPDRECNDESPSHIGILRARFGHSGRSGVEGDAEVMK